jgi:hypothetical protein
VSAAGRSGNSGRAAVSTAQIVDASEGVYWDASDMEWEVNDTHIFFPRNAERAPIRLRTLYFLAGVASRADR